VYLRTDDERLLHANDRGVCASREFQRIERRSTGGIAHGFRAGISCAGIQTLRALTGGVNSTFNINHGPFRHRISRWRRAALDGDASAAVKMFSTTDTMLMISARGRRSQSCPLGSVVCSKRADSLTHRRNRAECVNDEREKAQREISSGSAKSIRIGRTNALEDANTVTPSAGSRRVAVSDVVAQNHHARHARVLMAQFRESAEFFLCRAACRALKNQRLQAAPAGVKNKSRF